MDTAELQEKRVHIPRTLKSDFSFDWQYELANSLTSAEDLFQAGLFSLEESRKLKNLEGRFRIRVPRYYASLIDPANLKHCPIALQALPQIEENDFDVPLWMQEWSTIAFGRPTPWTSDPIGDLDKLETSRLTHRYGNRALLHVSSMCALFCRFCFRKTHLNEKEKFLYDGAFDLAYQYLKTHNEIEEVILTGGDPLSLTDKGLSSILREISEIAHIEHVRIHTRMPVTLPSRMTNELKNVLKDFEANSGKRITLVTHFNHEKELSETALKQIEKFTSSGLRVLNQSVLLKGVNDDARTLERLFQGLYNAGMTPFYLHHTDWTDGTFHFRRSLEDGRQIYRELSGRISGPALPHYVLDLPGGDGKVLLMDVERVKKISEKSDERIGGALYEIAPAHTKEHPETLGARKSVYYADFFFKNRE